jgi:endonuclease/exonuclease/phosphatase family metal-dependent hydrolase
VTAKRSASTLLACLGSALCALAPAARAGEPERGAIELAVLTYNTHGLPAWLAGDGPAERFPKLLARAARYDLVLVQEDFAFHDLVRRHRRHPVLLRGNGAWLPWPFLQGAGLTLLSHLPWLHRHARPYGVCHGWLAAASDCIGNKGFLMARLALANGAVLDVWTTHLDAGDAEGDDDARAAQLGLLADEIETRSPDRALLVGGDLNLHWGVAHDRRRLEGFAQRLGLAEAARPSPDSGWRQIDYLLVRSGVGAAIEVLGGGVDAAFVDDDGNALSDHPAVFTRLRVR